MNIKVGYDESSKAVTAHIEVAIDTVVDDITVEGAMDLAEKLYTQAENFAQLKSMKKVN